MKLLISKISLDGSTQARAGLDEATIESYAESMTAGDTFPPVVVFHDGSNHWLADGFHRIAAAKSLGHDKVEAEVKAGSREDAVWYAVGTNLTNGLRRTNEDKRRAVELVLVTWPEKSDRAIADHLGVSPTTVSATRKGLTVQLGQSQSRQGRDGRIINTANIGKTKTKEIVDSDTGEVLDNAEIVTTTRETMEPVDGDEPLVDFGIDYVDTGSEADRKKREDSKTVTLLIQDVSKSVFVLKRVFPKKFLLALGKKLIEICSIEETV